MEIKTNPGELVAMVVHWITLAIGYGLLGLVLAAVASRYGFGARWLPVVQPTELAYLAGAWWLYRGGAVVR